MDCERVQQELSAYFRGDLPLETRAEVQRHLSECPTCAEEAAAMKEFGQKLYVGITDWVNQGVCPTDLMRQIEGSIRSISGEARGRRRWYHKWPVMAGAAAAAAVLLLLVGTKLGMHEQVAAIPLVGPLATQLFSGVSDHHLDGFRLVEVNQSDAHDGIRLTVSELEAGTDQTRIHYSVEGQALDSSAADAAVYGGILEGAGGRLMPVRVTIVKRKAGLVIVDADFAPVTQGEPLTFRVNGLPLADGVQGTFTWGVTFKG